MKRYELKDQAKHVMIEAAFPGFTQELQEATSAAIDYEWKEARVRVFGDGIHAKIVVDLNQIRKNDEYTPDAWNEFPLIKPPANAWNVWMQCEGHFTTGGKFKGGAVYDGEHWYVPILGTLARYNIVIERFRPWDGKGEKNADEVTDH